MSEFPTIQLDPIPGYPGYLACRLGAIFRFKTRKRVARPLTPVLQPSDYMRVCLSINKSKYQRYVHHLILETYVGPCPPGMECLHGPGGRRDNSVENLRWGTHRENIADRERDGTTVRGERHPRAKLTTEDIHEIRNMRPMDAARRFGIDPSYARKIKAGKFWSHIK
jgi:hypothetical protein